ncbi:MAG: FAD-binding oxidoreductase [Dehalococcoidia bacterium]
MKQIPYWLDTAPPGPDYSQNDMPSLVDVAVVGGGLTGLSAALHLARVGASVALFEKDTIGFGASGRNGGMCTTGLTISFIKAIRQYGFPTASQLFLTYNAAIDTVEKLVSDEDIDCDFARTGKLNLAAKPDHYDALARTHETLATRLGYETHLVPKSRLQDEIGSRHYHGGMVDPQGAGLHVGKFVRGLAAAADRTGVSLHERTPLTTLRRVSGSIHDVVTSRGRVRASEVLVATNGYTGAPLPWYRRRIVPVGSFIIVTEPLEGDLVEELMPTRRMASDSKNLLYYFRITPDQRMLFGGRARFAVSSPASDLKSGRILQQAMAKVFPQIAQHRVDYTWGGQVGMTLDRMPHAGEHEGVHYSMGYCGHGAQMATYMGRQMAEVIGGNPDANPWRDFDFRAVPGHFGPPWFLPFVDAYYRLKDAIR